MAATASRTRARPPTRAADEAATRSWLSVVRAYNLCDALMARRLGALGVRTAEHEILANLRREPGLSQQALAARCFTAKSHISALLTALEERGWLRREPDPADARAKRLFLEPAGARMAERTARVQEGVVAAMGAAITPAVLAQVHVAMTAVSERLQAEIDAGE
jgi:DNA-binding MarR family transcriptional regulator